MIIKNRDRKLVLAHFTSPECYNGICKSYDIVDKEYSIMKLGE